MKVDVENTKNKNEVKLNFIVKAEKFDEAIKKVYIKTAKYFTVPGFRKGKAPIQIIERYYGSGIFYEDAFNELLPEVYEKAIKEENIDVVSKPNIDIIQIEKGKDLIFTAVVQIKPKVQLGQYKGIELKKIEYNVSGKDIENELKGMAESNARLISIEDRPVEKGDFVTIDFEGFLNGVPFEGGKKEQHELEIGSNSFIPGFEDQLIGMKLEQEKEIDLNFPKDYFSKELAGKPVIFKVKLHEIKKKELPQIDDEFAKDVSEFDTLAELKGNIKNKLKEANNERAKNETEETAIKAVCGNVDLEIPSGMIDTEIEQMIKRLKQKLQYQGLTLEQYCQILGKTENSMREEMKGQAEESVKTQLVLEAIANAEQLKAEEKEIKDRLKEMAIQYLKTEKEVLENEYLKDYTKNCIEIEKALQFIIDNSKKSK